jgi:hypothetical protein
VAKNYQNPLSWNKSWFILIFNSLIPIQVNHSEPRGYEKLSGRGIFIWKQLHIPISKVYERKQYINSLNVRVYPIEQKVQVKSRTFVQSKLYYSSLEQLVGYIWIKVFNFIIQGPFLQKYTAGSYTEQLLMYNLAFDDENI